MALLFVKVGDQSKHAAHYKDGDVVTILDDGAGLGRMVCKAQWVAEGLKGLDAEGVDRSGQTADNWPGGFEIVQVPGPKEDYLHLLEEGPVRVRGLPDYKSLPTDGDPNSNVRVAASLSHIDTLSVDRAAKVDVSAFAPVVPDKA